MNIREGKVVYPDLSYTIVGALFEVYNNLGYGYKEISYQKALEKEFTLKNVSFVAQAPYVLKYKNKIIAKRYLDFIIDEKIVLEIKGNGYFSRQNFVQVIEYLKITNLKLAILANFTNKGVEYKRLLNIRKDNL